MKKIFSFAVCVFAVLISFSRQINVYPTNWWVGMKWNKLQLMIHEKNIAAQTFALSPYTGVKILKVNKAENPNYVFLDLVISSNAKPGKLEIRCYTTEGPNYVIPYELKARSKEDGKTRVRGVTSKDFVYLIMPDRFSNGDPSNDIIPGYRDQVSDRKNMFAHHGGDFKGIENHLDYLNQLGVTTLWLTPVIENDMPMMNEQNNNVAGYHGYWFTDHYQVDKRYGGNVGYKEFCDGLHEKGMKVIQDAVYNHVGNHHFFILDPPMKDWLNNWTSFQATNHREETLFDPYASDYDRKIMLDGWFVPHLPDLNQRNSYVANFLIQHAIWTTEEYGIDGWRVDTYKYCDEQFLNNINAALEKEFPGITVFGEASVNSVIGNAYFTRNNISTPFKHNAGGVLDFETCRAMLAGMNEPFGWTAGVNKLYMNMAQDVVYKEPMNNCIFLDNHDMDRVYSVVDEAWSKFKMGLTWLLTLRGIPQLYYGTEVLMKNKKNTTDATVREDFPGGWSDDKTSRFTVAGRTDNENEAFNFVSALANYRKNSSALTTGKTMQFVPKDGLYIYFRFDSKQTIMIVANTGDKPVRPKWDSYIERTTGFTKLKDVITGKIIAFGDLELQPKECFVLELAK
jgi:neopullulanase